MLLCFVLFMYVCFSGCVHRRSERFSGFDKSAVKYFTIILQKKFYLSSKLFHLFWYVVCVFFVLCSGFRGDVVWVWGRLAEATEQNKT